MSAFWTYDLLNLRPFERFPLHSKPSQRHHSVLIDQFITTEAQKRCEQSSLLHGCRRLHFQHLPVYTTSSPARRPSVGSQLLHPPAQNFNVR